MYGVFLYPLQCIIPGPGAGFWQRFLSDQNLVSGHGITCENVVQHPNFSGKPINRYFNWVSILDFAF